MAESIAINEVKEEAVDLGQEEYVMHAFGMTARQMLCGLRKLYGDSIEDNLKLMEAAHGKRLFKTDVGEIVAHFLRVYDERIKERIEPITTKLFHVDERIIYDDHLEEDLEYTAHDLKRLDREIDESEEIYKKNMEKIRVMETQLEWFQQVKPIGEEITKLEEQVKQIVDYRLPFHSQQYKYNYLEQEVDPDGKREID